LAGQYDNVNPLVGPKQDDDVQTLITFNKGGQWEDLRPPSKRYDGTPYNCSLVRTFLRSLIEFFLIVLSRLMAVRFIYMDTTHPVIHSSIGTPLIRQKCHVSF